MAMVFLLFWVDYSGARAFRGTAAGCLERKILTTKKGPAVKSRSLVEVTWVLGIRGLGGTSDEDCIQARRRGQGQGGGPELLR